MQKFIEKKILLKAFSGFNTFEKFHVYLCKLVSLMDIFRDVYITWITCLKAINEFYSFWFKAIKYDLCLICGELFNSNSIKHSYCKNHIVHKNCVPVYDKCVICNTKKHPLSKYIESNIPLKYSLIKNYKKINCPLNFKLTSKNLNKIDQTMTFRFEIMFNDYNQDNIANSLGSIFGNVNEMLLNNSNKNYTLKVKNEPRTVTICSMFLDTINFINSQDCKLEVKDKIFKLRKKEFKKYKPSEYKQILLVEDYITQDYYICKKSDLIKSDVDGICDKFNYQTIV